MRPVRSSTSGCSGHASKVYADDLALIGRHLAGRPGLGSIYLMPSAGMFAAVGYRSHPLIVAAAGLVDKRPAAITPTSLPACVLPNEQSGVHLIALGMIPLKATESSKGTMWNGARK